MYIQVKPVQLEHFLSIYFVHTVELSAVGRYTTLLIPAVPQPLAQHTAHSRSDGCFAKVSQTDSTVQVKFKISYK